MQPIAASKVIFDLDGTLVDTAPDLLAATNHVLSQVGRPALSIDQVRHMVGFGAMHLIKLGLKATGGIDNHDLDGLLNKFLDYYTSNVAVASRPFEGTVKMLETLKAEGFRLSVCTNKPTHLAVALLSELKMDVYFDCIIGGDTLPYKKPKPEPILLAIAKTEGNGPAVMVGDSSADIGGAKNADIPSILVTFGYSAVPHEELKANRTITAMAALPACLTLAATE